MCNKITKEQGAELALKYANMIIKEGLTQNGVANRVGKSGSHVQKCIKKYLDMNNIEHRDIREKLNKENIRKRKQLAIMNRKDVPNKVVETKIPPVKDINSYFQHMCTLIDKNVAIWRAANKFDKSYAEIKPVYEAWRREFIQN